MKALRVVVLGAGVSGLAAALSLARAGHRVTLVERDPVDLGEPQDSVGWMRRGIPQILQAHAFTPRGRLELLREFPDVFASLLDAGADDLDLVTKLPGGERRPGDEELRFIGVRRPLIEWALRKAVLADPGVELRSEVTATGLDGIEGAVPRVTGVRTAAGSIEADLVVDALGRRSPVPDWIAGLGGTPMAEETSDCCVIYYTRYFRVREGRTLPDSTGIPTPRADLGYGVFSTFPGDNGTFAALIAIPPGAQDLKVLRHATAFDAASALMPALWSWVNPDTSEPITDVLAMGSLQNVLRTPVGTHPPAIGLISIGDALCHTDPVFSLGLSFALIDARELRTSLEAASGEVEAAALAFEAAVRPDIVERYAFASAVDDLRNRRWMGEPLDITRRDGGAYPLFIMAAGMAAALHDPEVFRRMLRRNYFLDSLQGVDEDVALQERIERIFAGVLAEQRPRPGPTREELLETITAALAGAATPA